VKIHKAVRVRTLSVWYILMNVLEEHFGSTQVIRKWRQYVLTEILVPIRWHGSITQNTIILNLNNMHFPCIVTLTLTNYHYIRILGNRYMLLFYNILWRGQNYVRKNVIKNNMVEGTWFVMVWMLQFFSGILNGVVKSGCHSDVMRYSSTNYHQAHVLRAATEQRRLIRTTKPLLSL
jgi:hypothetical protein